MNLVVTAYPETALASVPDVDVEVAFASGPNEAPVWRSVAGLSDVRGFSSKRGRNRELDRFAAGQLSVDLDNRDRWYDPTYTAGPFYGKVLPNRRTRVLARYSGTTYVVFDGFIDGWPQEYVQPREASVPLTATDGFKMLSRVDLDGSYGAYIESIGRPDHWYRLAETSGTVAVDSGTADPPIPLNHVSSQLTLASAAVVPYNDGREAPLYAGAGSITPTSADGTVAADVITGTTATVVCWFSDTGTAGNAQIWRVGGFFGGASDAFPRWFVNFIIGGTIGLYHEDTTGGTKSVTTSSTYANDGINHCAVGVYNATGITFYFDGALVGSTAVTVRAPAGLLFQLGSGTAGTQPFDGRIGEVAIWNNRELSATEVSGIYTAGFSGLSGQATGTVAGSVCDSAGIPSSGRDLDTGSSTIQATDLTGNALDLLQALHDTEVGQFYMGRDGALSGGHEFQVVWRQRHALLTASRSTTSQATFGDGGGSELQYAEIEIDYDDQQIRNDVRVTRTGGAEQRAYDATSQRDHGIVGYSKSGTLAASDNDSYDQANYLLARGKDPEVRIAGLTLMPQRDPADLWPQALGREIGDRITVKRRPQGVGDAISVELIIEGIEHSFDGETWVTKFALSPGETTQFWVLDDSTLSVLDTSTRLAF